MEEVRSNIRERKTRAECVVRVHPGLKSTVKAYLEENKAGEQNGRIKRAKMKDNCSTCKSKEMCKSRKTSSREGKSNMQT
jgi:hypothetical protein